MMEDTTSEPQATHHPYIPEHAGVNVEQVLIDPSSGDTYTEDILGAWDVALSTEPVQIVKITRVGGRVGMEGGREGGDGGGRKGEGDVGRMEERGRMRRRESVR